jgi:hypothetical protein
MAIIQKLPADWRGVFDLTLTLAHFAAASAAFFLAFFLAAFFHF